jgi:hypothetical protein
MTDLPHTVFVYGDLNSGEIVTCHLDMAKHFAESEGNYKHLATIRPDLWIKTHYDMIYGTCAPGMRADNALLSKEE